MKLTARVVMLAVAVAALCAGGASWLALREVGAVLETDARHHAEEVTRAFAESLYVSVMLEDEAGIAARLRGFGLEEGVVAARVTSAAARELAALPPRTGAAAFLVSVPVEGRPPSLDPESETATSTATPLAPAVTPFPPIGFVEATFSLASPRTSLARIQRAVLIVTMVLFAVAALAGAAFAASIVRPLRRLEAATGRVARGDLSSMVEASGADEVAGLARSFNEMVLALSHSREEVRAAAVELARREHLASLGQFTSMIAHEIRNPLGIILSSAQVAQNDARTPEQRREALGYIGDEVRRLNRILTEFLRFARPRDPVTADVDLAAVVTGAVERYDAPEGVRVEIAPSTAPPVSADPDLLHQALLNLVRNAVEAGAKNVVLRVGSGNGNGDGDGNGNGNGNGRTAWIEVSDDGPGFPPEALARAGEPFFTTKVAGSGLGLAVVRQIAAAHGGRLELGGDENGARVRLHLPRGKKERDSNAR